jgi:hypothetical protein
MGGACSTNEIDEKCIHGRPRHTCEDNIKTDLRNLMWEGVDWIHLAQDRDREWALVNTAMKLRIP